MACQQPIFSLFFLIFIFPKESTLLQKLHKNIVKRVVQTSQAKYLFRICNLGVVRKTSRTIIDIISDVALIFIYIRINFHKSFLQFSYSENRNDYSEIISTHFCHNGCNYKWTSRLCQKKCKKRKKLWSATVAVFILKMAGFAAVFTQFLSY